MDLGCLSLSIFVLCCLLLQERHHPSSSLWSLSLKFFLFSSPLGLVRVCFLPLYPFFLLTFVFIYIFILPS